MDKRLILIATLVAWTGQSTSAKDYGVRGHLFEVREPSVLEAIKTRLGVMEATGAIDDLKEEMQGKTRAYVNRPRPVLGLMKADSYHAFDVDLSITLERDLKDHEGRVFAKAGTVINPLDYSGYAQRIVMFDGDDPAQVEFALSEGDEINTLLVITNGAPLELMRSHGRRFFFDQDGILANRFSIERLPSVITRADPMMLVEEIPVGEK